MIYALLHIVGTTLVLIIIFLISGILLHVKWGVKRLNEVLELAAYEKGIRVEDMFNREHNSEMCSYLYEKYSSDKFVNRLSDMFRPIFVVIDYISVIISGGFVVMITYFAFTEDIEIAKFAWFAVPISLIFIIIYRVFYWFCFLLTGRGAGEAKSLRKLITEEYKLKD